MNPTTMHDAARARFERADDRPEDRRHFEFAFWHLDLKGAVDSWSGEWQYAHPFVHALWDGFKAGFAARASRNGEAE